VIKSIIVATSVNYVIGYQGRMPWHMPADLQHFRRLTYGHWLIVGRKTFEGLPTDLPGRKIIVLSQDPHYQAKNCRVATHFETALEQASKDGETEIFIAGGGLIYKQALPWADKIYWTLIKTEVMGDTFFPMLEEGCWREISRQSYPADKAHGYEYDFIELASKKSWRYP
jgi:dihydrofolate reductase